jgi:hypothetical protein
VSFAVDVNILVHAVHPRSARFEAARAFLEAKAVGPELFCLAWITALSYLRLVTHAGVLGVPLAPASALNGLRSLIGQPHVRMLSEREGFLDAYERVTAGQVVRGKLVPDAHLAAILFQHGVRTLYTADRDFRRFDFLDVRDPYAA